jgi:hypothetical protein
MRTPHRLITAVRKRNVALPLVVTAVLVGGSGAALAATTGGPIDSQGVIHGCWSNAALNGATGPAGAPGPAGPAGPSTAGPNGLDTTIVSISGRGSAFAQLPGGPSDRAWRRRERRFGRFLDVSVPDVLGEESQNAGWIAQDVQGTPITTYAICAK